MFLMNVSKVWISWIIYEYSSVDKFRSAGALEVTVRDELYLKVTFSFFHLQLTAALKLIYFFLFSGALLFLAIQNPRQE